MHEEKALIPFKSTKLNPIQKRIDKALAVTRKHYDTEPTGEEFELFVQDLYSAFPPTIRYDVVFASTMNLAGKKLTRNVIRDTAWRLAGNIDRLKKGVPCPPFLRQTVLEWCPITIVRAMPGRGYDGNPGYFYDYRVMAGQAAGLKFTTFWSVKYARFVARAVGFRKTKKVYLKFVDGSEMVRMKLYLLFDPALSKEDKPAAYHFYVPDSFRKDNQQILKQRYRIIPCPLGYLRSELACHNCPQGYDKCPAGCHPVTYVEKACPRCQQDATWFDPLSRGIVCIDCETHDRKRRS